MERRGWDRGPRGDLGRHSRAVRMNVGGADMVYKGVVRDGRVKLPPEADLPDGTVVRIEADSPKRFGDLLDLAGTWVGDDADRIVEEIYQRRSSAPPRAAFDS